MLRVVLRPQRSPHVPARPEHLLLLLLLVRHHAGKQLRGSFSSGQQVQLLRLAQRASIQLLLLLLHLLWLPPMRLWALLPRPLHWLVLLCQGWCGHSQATAQARRR